jgi:hypothetical protein
MIKKLIAIILLSSALACEPEKEMEPKGTDLSEVVPGNEPYKPTHPVFKRSVSENAGVANMSGPAFKANGQKQSLVSAKTESVPFQVNAGAIWQNPADGATHIWAMQLPSSDGPIQEASLGAGWEGTYDLAMDHQYFYAVHDHNIYRINKQKFNDWQLVVPSNGKRIDAIHGDQNFLSGFFFIREDIINYYNGSSVTPLLKHPVSGIRLHDMVVIRDGVNGVHLCVIAGSNQLWKLYITSTFTQKWLKMNDYEDNVFNQRLIGDPEQYRIYESGVNTPGIHSFRINIINPNTGIDIPIGFYHFLIDNDWPVPDGPTNALFLAGELAVNNSWLWMSAKYNPGYNPHSLFKIRTLGSTKGQIQAEYTGWEGTIRFCAYPQLHFN